VRSGRGLQPSEKYDEVEIFFLESRIENLFFDVSMHVEFFF